MIQLTVSIPDFEENQAVQAVWTRLQDSLRDTEGIAYYRHPVIGASNGRAPDLVVLARGYQPVALTCLGSTIEELELSGSNEWRINGQPIGNPLGELQDFYHSLRHRFDRDRTDVRDFFDPVVGLVLPQVRGDEYAKKFGDAPSRITVFTREWSPDQVMQLTPRPPTDFEWKIAKSIFQAAAPLRRGMPQQQAKQATLGSAIREMEKAIALLDDEQTKVAVQVPPGPQRIRGLAGTGKTVLLAMKAANIHARYPDAKILFTFHTQSLYNLTRHLITRFYRYHHEEDPDWNNLQVRHSWGGKYRRGVYADLCAMQGQPPLDLTAARRANPEQPFIACCQAVLARPIPAVYDFILVDEAQDFPTEFFRVLYALVKGPEKRIYWAYDSIQNLTGPQDMPEPGELFGKAADGTPLVNLDGVYAGQIEKDLILRKSYRSPLPVLMLAHAIGLGLYNKDGCVQMLATEDAWLSSGYEIEEGTPFEKGKRVRIRRPTQNSPNDIRHVYSGTDKTIAARAHLNRADEVKAVVEQIRHDVRDEGVEPSQIVVISLDSIRARDLMQQVQTGLLAHQIPSVIPGLVDDSSMFGEEGRVTLSTIYRAKGNEAPIVYIMGFEMMYLSGGQLTSRNMAFTSISRSKGWVRISGSGPGMKRAVAEIKAILDDLPAFNFVYPDMEKIRRLDVETSEMRRKRAIAQRAARNLVGDPTALKALGKEELDRLIDALRKAKDEAE